MPCNPFQALSSQYTVPPCGSKAITHRHIQTFRSYLREHIHKNLRMLYREFLGGRKTMCIFTPVLITHEAHPATSIMATGSLSRW